MIEIRQLVRAIDLPLFNWITKSANAISLVGLRSVNLISHRNIARRIIVVIAVSAGSLASVNAWAQGNFLPTESEWAVWPPYCQARYVDIPMGQATKYSSRISRAQISAIQMTLSPDTYHPIHHYCFGIGYMMRARQKSPTAESTEYKFLLRSVIRESQYTFRRIDLADPIAAQVAHLMATAHSLLGEPGEGIKLLEHVIAASPTLPGAYVATALLYRRHKETVKAIETVDRALERVTVPSAELYYTAAMAYIDKHELQTAQNYAVEAYKLGYPLPGLQRKLAKLGYWPPKTETLDE